MRQIARSDQVMRLDLNEQRATAIAVDVGNRGIDAAGLRQGDVGCDLAEFQTRPLY